MEAVEKFLAARTKDEYNAADGRLGRKTRPKRDRQPPV